MTDADHIALIVGGASGVGAACAEALVAAGRRVVVADLADVDAAAGGYAGAVRMNVRDRDAVFAAVAAVVAEHGPIGTLVNAAGTARVTPLDEIGAKEWDLILDINLNGAFHVLQAVAAEMPAGGGAMVLISSIDADVPVPGLAHYCAAKAGMESLVRSAAIELGARNIRVNAVAPGVVRTPLMAPQLDKPEVEAAFLRQIPLGRIADPADIAGLVTFLTTPAGSWITGTSIPIDGGMRLREHPALLDPPTSQETHPA